MNNNLIRNLFLCVLAALVLRVAMIFLIGNDSSMYRTNDTVSYVQLAYNLEHHKEFSDSAMPPLIPDTIRTPGYPLFLSLFDTDNYQNFLPVVWAQTLIGCLTVGILYWTAWILWRDRLAALTVGIVAACDYVLILYSVYIMTEAVFLCLLSLSILCFAKFLTDSERGLSALVGAALLSGLATMVRPVSLYYFLAPTAILAIWGIFYRQRLMVRNALIYGVMASLIPLAWMWRNYHVAGAFTFTTIQELTRATILEEHLQGIGYVEAEKNLVEKFKKDYPVGFESRALESAAKSKWAIKYVLRHPKEYMVVLAKETVRLVAGNGMRASAWMIFKDRNYNPALLPAHVKESNTEQVQTLYQNHPSIGIGLVCYLSFLGVIYLLCAFGALKGFKKHPLTILWLAVTTLYFFLVSIGFGTGARYRLPLMMQLYLLAGLGFAQLRSRLGLHR